MRRELWSIGCAFGYAVRVLNSIFCTDCKSETELNEDETWLVVEQINSMCSDMMITDAQDILNMVSSIPFNRLCERTDCRFHHPENFQRQNFVIFSNKCSVCSHNKKCKLKDDDWIDNFKSK